MRISKVGGVIAAAGNTTAKPMLRLGTIPIVQRLVITYQQAGIFPIVVVTGIQADEVKYQLAGRGVVFVHNPRFAQADLLGSARIGLEFLADFCGKIAFAPVNSPLVTPASLRTLLRSKADVARLSHGGRGGHPVLLSHRAVAAVLADRDASTLRDAFDRQPGSKEWIDTGDEGVLLTIHREKGMRDHLAAHNREYIHPYLRISLENEEDLFSPRLKILLFLVMKTHSVAQARKQVGLSNSTAWNMLNRLEGALGYPVVVRTKGGATGSRSSLTEKGTAFLAAWQRYEEAVRKYADDRFGRVMDAFIGAKDM